jgi:hypothetical protein
MSVMAANLTDTTKDPLVRLRARSMRDEYTGCMYWLGPQTNMGYGQISYKGKRWYQHRLSYFLFAGSIDRRDVGHRCHDEDPTCGGGIGCPHRLCWEPTHLIQQTRQENLLSGKTVPAARAAQTHCVHGHEFTEANTRIRKNGTRKCRKCDAIKSREYRGRQWQ